MRTRFTFIIAVIFMIAAAGCSSSKSTDPEGTVAALSSTPTDYPSVLEAQGYKVIDSITTGSDTGYLSENADGKRCIVLKGSPYNMGYQFGRLLPEST